MEEHVQHPEIIANNLYFLQILAGKGLDVRQMRADSWGRVRLLKNR